ncbi:MAG: hypothetical protein M9913_04665 [Bryobacteraceae bacterium]|nr:hypothetical protein [Bryobacteraceae bacterium]
MLWRLIAAGGVQTTMRPLTFVAALVFLAATAPAQIWPEQWREHRRTKAEAVTIPSESQAIWSEYQGEAAERATYSGPIGAFRATAYRLADATSAFAWFQFLRPANCTPALESVVLCATPGSQFMAHMNHVLVFEGWRPLPGELAALYPALPGLRSGGGLPQLPGFLPEKDRIRNSERYILGIDSLSQFEPAIDPILAGFEDSAEAISARYRTPGGGTVNLTLFYYPTPQVARTRVSGFEQQPGFNVKRSGSLIAVIPGGHDPAQVQPLLDAVEYDLNFVWNEATKDPPMPDVAGMLIAIFELTGILLVSCILGGVLFAVLWFYLRRRQHRIEGSEATITILDLGKH